MGLPLKNWVMPLKNMGLPLKNFAKIKVSPPKNSLYFHSTSKEILNFYNLPWRIPWFLNWGGGGGGGGADSNAIAWNWLLVINDLSKGILCIYQLSETVGCAILHHKA